MYDFIVLGASGFTGKNVLEAIINGLKSDQENFTYAIAGRSEKKLEQTLIEVGEATNTKTHLVDLILCDVEDKRSLVVMAEQCRVVLNCVGPYRFHGKNVVEACIEAGAHYVDVSGEPEFLESVQKDYFDAALARGIYVVGACGFDSIPADLGTVFLAQNFDGDLNSVEEYVEFTNKGQEQPKIHYGTWASAVHGFANMDKLRPIRTALSSIEPIPLRAAHRLIKKPIIHYNKTVRGWCVGFPGSDRSVMLRTQRLLYRLRNQRPVQVAAYANVQTFSAALILFLATMMFVLMVKLPCRLGQWFLLEFPRLMSFGYVSHEGPSKQEMDNLEFTVSLYGQGWSKKCDHPDYIHVAPPNKKKVVKVSGVNPGYGATCACLIQSAITILREKKSMPLKGGVYPPGAAFSETGLIERLQLNGISFEICDVN